MALIFGSAIFKSQLLIYKAVLGPVLLDDHPGEGCVSLISQLDTYYL